MPQILSSGEEKINIRKPKKKNSRSYVQGTTLPRALGRLPVKVLKGEFPDKVYKEERPRVREDLVQRHCCVNLQEDKSYLPRTAEDETREAGILYSADLESWDSTV